MSHAPIDALLAEHVRETLRGEIAGAGGAEVAFYGRVDGEGVVTEVEVVARGHDTAVPAMLSRADGFDVALHNHPGGDLRPSDADLGVAMRLAEQGVGFIIIANDAMEAYVVVPPRVLPRLEPVRPEELADLLGPAGPIARLLGDSYEERPGQLRMSQRVAEAFIGDRIALLESGTGTGKTFAYLAPAALWALRNGEKVVVSTATKNLQAQISNKDVPNLLQALGEAGSELQAVVVKGRGNYVSLRRAEEAGAQQLIAFESPDEQREVQRLVAWARQTATGDIAELTPPPAAEAWEHVSSQSDNCLSLKCPHFGQCHYYRSRRAASRAQILIVNHHLLFSDLAIKQETGFDQGAALPPFRRVILDEAHHAEAIGSEHFGLQVTERGLARPLGRLRSKKSAVRGLLPSLLSDLGRLGPERWGKLARQVEDQLLPLRDKVARQVEEAFRATAARLRGELGETGGEARELKLRVAPDQGQLLEPLGEAQQGLAILAARLTRFVDQAEGRGSEEERRGLRGLLLQLKAAAKRLGRGATSVQRLVAAHDPTSVVRWAELRRDRQGRERLKLRAAPIEIGPTLRKALFEPAKSVVLSSATLTVAGGFAYLESRLGLEGAPRGEPIRDVVPSPFDYARQALLAVPTDLPEPGAPGYDQTLAAIVRDFVRRARGRAFVLFTSYGALRRAHDALAPELEAAGLVPLRQGSASREQLIRRFVQLPGAVLFGTDSFWEGVDVPGDDLVLVLIARLPFLVPSEPLQLARAEAVAARGGNPFRELQLPQAVLKLTQGFGRLIRTRADRGVVVVLDRRIVSRWYGRHFFESLPPVRVEVAPTEVLLGEAQLYLRA